MKAFIISIIISITALFASTAQAAESGIFYDPTRDGEGVTVFIDESQFVGFFYTYRDEDHGTPPSVSPAPPFVPTCCFNEPNWFVLQADNFDGEVGSGVVYMGEAIEYPGSFNIPEVTGNGTGEEVAGSGSGEEVAGSGSGEEVAGSGSGEEVAGSGSGEEVAGSGSGEEVAGSGSGEEVAGSGSGEEVAGSGSGEEVTGNGTGEEVTGNGTGEEVTGNGTGEEVTGNGTGEEVTGNGTGEEGNEVAVIEPIGTFTVVRSGEGFEISIDWEINARLPWHATIYGSTFYFTTALLTVQD
jgi:hypothetical protein